MELRKDLDEQLPRIAAALKQSEPKEALELLHSLKGCAATLGARRVSEAAAALEIRLRRGEAVVLTDLEAASTELKESIVRIVVNQAPAPAASLPPLDRSLLLPIARRLDEQLEANNFAAVKCFEELRAAAGPRFSEVMQRLEQTLDRLDFNAARAHLRDVESQLTAEEAT